MFYLYLTAYLNPGLMKQFLAFLIICCTIFLFSCRKYGYYHYRMIGLKAYNQDNSGRIPVDTNAAYLPAKAYCIRLEYSYVYAGADDEVSKTESEHVTDNNITDFKIYTLTDFDSTHPALSALNEYFLNSPAVIPGTGNRGEPDDPNRIYTVSRTLMMMKMPSSLGYRKFVIEAAIDNARVADTLSITLF